MADTTQSTEKTTQDTTQVTQGIEKTIQDTTQVRLTEDDKAVLAAIKEQHNITEKDIAAKLGWKVDRVKYYLNKMKHRNIVKRVGTSQHGYWVILIVDNIWL